MGTQPGMYSVWTAGWISSWMVRINTECQPINKLVKTINMKNIGLDRLIGPDVLSQYCDYFYMIG